MLYSFYTLFAVTVHERAFINMMFSHIIKVLHRYFFHVDVSLANEVLYGKNHANLLVHANLIRLQKFLHCFIISIHQFLFLFQHSTKTQIN